MKKLAGFVLFTGFCKLAAGQVIIALLFGEKLNSGKVEFGLVGGPAFTKISNIECDKRTGFNLGLYFNIRPDKKLFLHVEGTAKGAEETQRAASELAQMASTLQQLVDRFQV